MPEYDSGSAHIMAAVRTMCVPLMVMFCAFLVFAAVHQGEGIQCDTAMIDKKGSTPNRRILATALIVITNGRFLVL